MQWTAEEQARIACRSLQGIGEDMETLAVREDRIAMALPLQHFSGQHEVRKTYPDPLVFDKNGDGRFDAVDVVQYKSMGIKARVDTPEMKTEDNAVVAPDVQPRGIKQYSQRAEIPTDHAVEVAA